MLETEDSVWPHTLHDCRLYIIDISKVIEKLYSSILRGWLIAFKLYFCSGDPKFKFGTTITVYIFFKKKILVEWNKSCHFMLTLITWTMAASFKGNAAQILIHHTCIEQVHLIPPLPTVLKPLVLQNHFSTNPHSHLYKELLKGYLVISLVPKRFRVSASTRGWQRFLGHLMPKTKRMIIVSFLPETLS